MIDVLIIKALMLSMLWTLGWGSYFAEIDAYPNAKNLSIVFAPWIVIFIYIMFFWW